jgi:uncharacterized damage-inducible protein DinB
VALLPFILAGDLLARAMRQRREAIAEAAQGVREAERYLVWARSYSTPEQVTAAQALADEWRDYRDQL